MPWVQNSWEIFSFFDQRQRSGSRSNLSFSTFSLLENIYQSDLKNSFAVLFCWRPQIKYTRWHVWHQCLYVNQMTSNLRSKSNVFQYVSKHVVLHIIFFASTSVFHIRHVWCCGCPLGGYNWRFLYTRVDMSIFGYKYWSHAVETTGINDAGQWEAQYGVMILKIGRQLAEIIGVF